MNTVGGLFANKINMYSTMAITCTSMTISLL